MVGELADAYLAVTCAARQSVSALPVFDKWPRRSDTVGKQSSGEWELTHQDTSAQ